MPAATIRRATKDDLPAIQELWKEFMDFHKERDPFFSRVTDAHEDFKQFMQGNLEHEDWLILVATADNRVIAYGSATVMSYPPIYRDPRYGYIQDVAVTETYRGQGIGRQIYEQMAKWFREKDVSRLELEIAITNEVSAAFWQRLGFTDFSKKLTLNL